MTKPGAGRRGGRGYPRGAGGEVEHARARARARDGRGEQQPGGGAGAERGGQGGRARGRGARARRLAGRALLRGGRRAGEGGAARALGRGRHSGGPPSGPLSLGRPAPAAQDRAPGPARAGAAGAAGGAGVRPRHRPRLRIRGEGWRSLHGRVVGGGRPPRAADARLLPCAPDGAGGGGPRRHGPCPGSPLPLALCWSATCSGGAARAAHYSDATADAPATGLLILAYHTGGPTRARDGGAQLRPTATFAVCTSSELLWTHIYTELTFPPVSACLGIHGPPRRPDLPAAAGHRRHGAAAPAPAAAAGQQHQRQRGGGRPQPPAAVGAGQPHPAEARVAGGSLGPRRAGAAVDAAVHEHRAGGGRPAALPPQQPRAAGGVRGGGGALLWPGLPTEGAPERGAVRFWNGMEWNGSTGWNGCDGWDGSIDCHAHPLATTTPGSPRPTTSTRPGWRTRRRSRGS